jgi:hypothetical protein
VYPGRKRGPIVTKVVRQYACQVSTFTIASSVLPLFRRLAVSHSAARRITVMRHEIPENILLHMHEQPMFTAWSQSGWTKILSTFLTA